jgi:hypothetical protein
LRIELMHMIKTRVRVYMTIVNEANGYKMRENNVTTRTIP